MRAYDPADWAGFFTAVTAPPRPLRQNPGAPRYRRARMCHDLRRKRADTLA
jgi:hypothetical protein